MAPTVAATAPAPLSQRKIAWWEIGIGAFCLIAPLFASLAITYAIGLGLLTVGGLLFWAALAESKGARGRGWRVFEGLAIAALGLYFALVPLAGMALVTLVLALLLFVAGALRLLLAFAVKPARGWGWLAVAGAAAILCGAVLLTGLPFSGTWAPGVLFGATLLTGGLARLTLAGPAR